MAEKNEFYKDFSNRKPYNNVPCKPDEILRPVVIDDNMKITLKDSGLDWNNVETWHFPYGKKPVPVAFIQIDRSREAIMEKEFNYQVRKFLGGGEKSLFDGETILSTDQLMEAIDDDDKKGYDPTASTENEDKADLEMTFRMLLEELDKYEEPYSRIISLLAEGYSKGEIIEMVDMGKGKSQGYEMIKKAQTIAKKIYDKNYR